MSDERVYSAKQVATRIGTEAKILRKFFRDPKSNYDAVGQGGQYTFPESELPKIKEAFDVWNSGRARRNRPTNAQREAAKKASQNGNGSPAAPRRRRAEAAPSPLDGDDLMTRCRMSIGERAKAHNLVTDKQGRFIPKPTPPRDDAEIEGGELDLDTLWDEALSSIEEEDN